jgi:hypothetical protein
MFSYLKKISISLYFISFLLPNALAKPNQKGKWVLLFDGKTTKGWRGAYRKDFPKHGWVVKDGELRGELLAGVESSDAGDIVTLKKYRNFELVFDWKIGQGGNSGVKYFIEERLPKPQGSQPGYEYQLIDDAEYIYNEKHLPQDLKTASIYDVIAADKPDTKIDIWHTSRILIKDSYIEHWLDNKRVLAIDRSTDVFKNGVLDSKFKDYPNFATLSEGHILLQDHGHHVAFKNIKIKEL